MILRGVTIFLQFIKVGGISPKVRQDIRGGGGVIKKFQFVCHLMNLYTMGLYTVVCIFF